MDHFQNLFTNVLEGGVLGSSLPASSHMGHVPSKPGMLPSALLLMVHPNNESTRLPPGYRLDLIDDPCVITLRREDGTAVARFTQNVDPEEIRQAAEEDHQ